MKCRKLLVAVVVGVVTGGLASCDGGPEAAVPSPSAVSTITARADATTSSTDLLAGRVLPLFAYQDSGEMSFAASRAEAVLKNRCLARFGFAPLPVLAANPSSPPMYRVFGITDPAIAAKYGYHLDPVGLANDPSSLPSQPAYSDALQFVLLGYAPGGEVPDPDSPVPRPTQTYQGKPVPPSGCQGEAVRQVETADVTGDELNLAQSLGADAFLRARDDRRMRAAAARWGSCMKTAGFGGDYNGPWDVWEGDVTGPLTRDEIATAVADVECKRETKLIDTWFAVEAEYENVAIQKNLETLTKVKRAREAALAKALEIVGNGGR